MTVEDVLKMGNPKLFEKSKPVTHFNTAELYAVIKDLKDTMNHYHGAGLAAPQIGYQQRIMVFGFDFNPRYPKEKPIPLTVLINPTITPLTDEKNEYWEGCVSVPGLRGLVSRFTSIRYIGFSPEGNRIECDVTGFHARVVQHEYDHLEGILFPQRIKNFQEFGFEDELKDRMTMATDA